MACLPTLLWLASLAALIINWQDVTGWVRYVYIGFLVLGPWTAAAVRTAFRQALADYGANLNDPLSQHMAMSEAKNSAVVNFWTKANMVITVILIGFSVYAFIA